ncbi:unnamed protein product [Penicillium discolor]
MWLTQRMLAATIPEENRGDFAAGGYALDVQDQTLRSLAALDVAAAVPRIQVPLWFVNGQYDQLRLNEPLFRRLAPEAELIVVPRTTHLITAMRPRPTPMSAAATIVISKVGAATITTPDAACTIVAPTASRRRSPVRSEMIPVITEASTTKTV